MRTVTFRVDYRRNEPPTARFNGKWLVTATATWFAGIAALFLLAATCLSVVRSSQWAIVLGCGGGATGGMFVALWRELLRQIRETSA